ncbi:MAG: aldehyde dehydrogenase [Solirubrobacteraceae bacterium]
MPASASSPAARNGLTLTSERRGGPPRHGLHIAGVREPAASDAYFGSVNPATGTVWAEFADAGAEDVDRAVAAATTAFASARWGALSPTRRGRLLMRFGDLMAEHAEELATVETRQNGKLVREMVGQMQMIPEWLYYFGGLADKIEGSVIPLDRQSVLNYTLREPLGVVGVITPWNSPMLLTTMAIAPALAAGNTVVIKPSEFTPASILDAAFLAEEAGIPSGVINVVTGTARAGAALVEHSGVAKVAFTGGDAAGRVIARSVAGRLGRYSLELGGKSPNIVFADAQLEAAEAGVLAGIFAAGGQTCVAGSRLLVQREVHDELVSRLVARAAAIRLGDPLDRETQMGPIATAAQLQRVDSMVQAARAAGAEVVAGGRRASVPSLPDGLFYEPTILTGVENADVVCQDEIFGPVLSVVPFADEREALALANASRYGLAAGVWTRDIKRGHRMARGLQAGTVWINTYRALTFSSPFGGYKDSGVGRANGIEAIGEYLQTKSVWCELSEEVQDPFVLKL